MFKITVDCELRRDRDGDIWLTVYGRPVVMFTDQRLATNQAWDDIYGPLVTINGLEFLLKHGKSPSTFVKEMLEEAEEGTVPESP